MRYLLLLDCLLRAQCLDQIEGIVRAARRSADAAPAQSGDQVRIAALDYLVERAFHDAVCFGTRKCSGLLLQLVEDSTVNLRLPLAVAVAEAKDTHVFLQIGYLG